MKKTKYILATIVILILVFITSIFSFDNLSKKEMFVFEMRYEFKTTIDDFKYPKKLPKNKYKNYWKEFQDINSNLNWFEPIKIQLNTDYIILDIKENYVEKINYTNLKINDLLVFNLSHVENTELFLILNQSKPSSIIESEVKSFCESKNDKFLYEKGIIKLITF
ncbi:hypothetical protein CG007_01950 [Mesoplasma entomophilum]|uniref:Uncharacterized protein n=1 Tax=Mesoplasma entomophilum TaxID=2149 RepID=A0A3S5Y041_9MOLU|nr:hypothetical protein [Mesoplasma entomophilum]ATQ35529.1 hypothetical protein CS528_01980 [Mesoplasma entomophilum]ATZ19491.1 hypothetical protein MENTO_v1c03850 [Mesoplasma entomophilum]AVN60378.1 hypothetical protein CG007_01950 [Mesoplasma entomophilum]